MEIYFLRTGIAENPLYESPEAELQRRLTEEGQENILKEAVGMKKIIKDFDLILTSPAAAAVQTAVIVGEVFKCGERIKEVQALAPPCSVEELLEEIALGKVVDNVLCIGHSPQLDEMATELVTGIDEEISFRFLEGSLLRLDMNNPDPVEDAQVVYFLHPKILVKLGETLDDGTVISFSPPKDKEPIEEEEEDLDFEDEEDFEDVPERKHYFKRTPARQPSKGPDLLHEELEEYEEEEDEDYYYEEQDPSAAEEFIRNEMRERRESGELEFDYEDIEEYVEEEMTDVRSALDAFLDDTPSNKNKPKGGFNFKGFDIQA